MTLTRLIPALFAAAALAAPAAGQTPEDLKKSIDRLEKAVRDLQDAKDGLRTDELRKTASTLDAKLDLIDKDIQDIKKDIRELKRKANGGTTTALRPEYDSATYRGQGRVRFINEFPEEMSVVVNNRSYRLLPGQERLFPVTPGEFTYQVLQLQRDAQVRRIAADETKTIRIYPLP